MQPDFRLFIMVEGTSKIFSRLLLILAATLFCGANWAQTIKPNAGQNQLSDNKQPSDSTEKKRKPRKPLESFYFNDSLRQQRIFGWNVSLLNNDITTVPVDTTIQDFRIDYSFMREDVGNAFIGNIGGANIPLNYFRRPQAKNFSFVDAWSSYILKPEDVIFYNTKLPFSQLNYQMSGAVQEEESLFKFVLAHNISPSTSLGVTYNGDGTKGLYNRQNALARYVEVHLAHTGKRYALHAGYIYNHGRVDENGGIENDKDVTDTIIDLPRNIKVNLQNANNTYRGNTFYITQSYGMPLRKQREEELTIQKIPTIYLGASGELSTFGRRYSAKGDASFYKTNYLSEEYTSDTISQTIVDLKAFTQLQPYNRDGVLGLITGGIGTTFENYYNEAIPQKYQSQFGVGGKVSKTSTYLYGAAEGALKKYLRWQATLRMNMLGYRAGDTDFRGSISSTAFIKGHPLTFDASLRLTLFEPDYWTGHYFSNHFAWANSFEKESATTFTARLTYPAWSLELAGNYQIVQKKVYYNDKSLPEQFGGAMSIMGVYLQKDFRLGVFRFNHRVLMQWSTNQEVVPVPLLSAYLSYFVDLDVVKNVLRLQLGVDGRFNTEYYAMGYNPAIAQFYNQREKKLGNYPYLDAFAAAKWKRMRIRLKLQHFNANLLENKNYFPVLHYPANRLMFKIGVSWAFYE